MRYTLLARIAIALPHHPALAAEFDAPVNLEIGKATTYVNGPLRKDGLIDYVQAYDCCARCCAGNVRLLLVNAPGQIRTADLRFRKPLESAFIERQ